jgi:glycosyltransferase involved in cell wall biosynthesis
MKEVAKEYDFLITTGVADPNPTTILEAMAWGFPVICTPQSGYYENEYITNVFHNDIEESICVLEKLQKAPEEYLVNVALRAREKVKAKYNWHRFSDRVLKNLF